MYFVCSLYSNTRRVSGGSTMFSSSRQSVSSSVSQFMYKVYAWMCGALFLTAATAYGVFTTPAIFMTLVKTPFLFYGLMFAQIGLVLFLSFRINKMSYGAAVVTFLLYAMLLGVTLSTIFAVYQLASIYTVFGITAGTFGTMALYGYFTKADLTSIGNIMGMALFGLILASVVNMFVGSQKFDYILSFLGVLIFTGLTAYDVQKIKDMGYNMIQHGESTGKVAIMGALTLYLDFINLFLYLLRLLGRRRD